MCPNHSHTTMSSARIDPRKRVLGLKEGCILAKPTHPGTSRSGCYIFFPADSAKPVPLGLFSLDSRQGHLDSPCRICSVLSWLRRLGKIPEEPFPVRPGQYWGRSARHVSSRSSPPTVDGLNWDPSPALEANPFPALGPLVFKGRRIPGHHATCGARPHGLPPAEPFPGFYSDRCTSYSLRPGSCPTGRSIGHALQRHPFSGLVDSARDYHRRPPPEFPLVTAQHSSPSSVPTGMLTLEPFSEDQGRSASTVRDPANQLPCALRVLLTH
ncbi:unnamed protein product [Brassica napus]|uniref:(rape) hypothetical protein n=1 Tax=Brassica napus TaxID=3708 RepID=A0A816SLX7_BRANA|nr:unnamed protein product [Brassica napus]